MNDEIITSYLLGKKAGGTTPTGEIDITQNGITNVSGYATANVQVPEKQLEEKSVTISSNTTTLIEPTQGKDGMSSVSVTTNIPGPSGKITITQNGTDIDVSSYASADVSVSGGANPTTPDECTTALKNVFISYVNYIEGVKANRETYTNNSVVLYTPNINCKSYFVRKRNNVYSVVWLNNWMVNCYNASFTPGYMSTNSIQSIAPRDEFVFNEGATFFVGNNTTGEIGYYSNETFSTPEEAIQAIINNQITYTQSTSTSFGYADFEYSNAHIFIETRPATGQQWTYKNTKIISHNETIQAIS